MFAVWVSESRKDQKVCPSVLVLCVPVLVWLPCPRVLLLLPGLSLAEGSAHESHLIGSCSDSNDLAE